MGPIVLRLRQRLLGPVSRDAVRSQFRLRRVRSFDHHPSGTDIGLGEVEGECAAFTGFAPQMDFAPKKVCELAADCEPETGSSVSPVGARVGLLEGLEDDALLLWRNANAGVPHLERNDG